MVIRNGELLDLEMDLDCIVEVPRQCPSNEGIYWYAERLYNLIEWTVSEMLELSYLDAESENDTAKVK